MGQITNAMTKGMEAAGAAIRNLNVKANAFDVLIDLIESGDAPDPGQLDTDDNVHAHYFQVYYLLKAAQDRLLKGKEH